MQAQIWHLVNNTDTPTLHLSATSLSQAGGNLLSPAAIAESINSQLKTGTKGL